MRYTRGVTLIETLIYLALFTIVVVGLLIAAYGLLENAGRNQSYSMLQEEKQFLIAKIDRALSDATSIRTPARNASSRTLSITGGSDGPVTFAALSGNLLRNGARLNNSNTTISDLVFIHHYTGSPKIERIEAGFTITAVTQNGMHVSEIASTTDLLHQ